MADDDEFLQAPRRPDEDRSSLITWVLSHTGVRMPESNDKVRAPRNPSAQHPIPAGKNPKSVGRGTHARQGVACRTHQLDPVLKVKALVFFNSLKAQRLQAVGFKYQPAPPTTTRGIAPAKTSAVQYATKAYIVGGARL